MAEHRDACNEAKNKEINYSKLNRKCATKKDDKQISQYPVSYKEMKKKKKLVVPSDTQVREPRSRKSTSCSSQADLNDEE